MKLAIVINSERLTPELKAQLEDPQFAELHGLSYDVFTPEPKDITSVLENLNAQSYNACIIGGGDGTVRGAIEILIDKNIPIAILPLGTFNFLATELKYPNDIGKLFAIIKNNKTKNIDIGEVNDRVFINHTWIGFYSNIIKMREKHKAVLGRSRFLKLLYSILKAFEPLPIYELEIETANERIKRKCCLAYVGNNDHTKTLWSFGARVSLSSGVLSVNLLKCQTHWQLLACMFSLLINRIEKSKYFEFFKTNNLVIETKSNNVTMVIDGELMQLTTPIVFKIFPKKLSVFLP